MMTFVKYINAEFIKLKYLPSMWLSGAVVMAVLTIIFAAHMLDVNAIDLNVDPWRKTLVACKGIFSTFMAIPFTVLFVSAALYIEHQSNAWKYQYTIPASRVLVVLAKLTAILLWLILTIILLTLGLILVGYLLNYFLPEYEFSYYKIPYFHFLESMSHIFIALLGVIGIQYFLSFRFKGFLIPASIGIVAFLCGMILGSINNKMALYFPYSYPVIVKDHGMFATDKINIREFGWLNNVEIYSIIVFVFFIGLTCFLERKRNIL